MSRGPVHCPNWHGHAIGLIGQEAAQPLTEMLTNSDWRYRFVASHCLLQLDYASVQAAVPALLQQMTNAEVRVMAVGLPGRLGSTAKPAFPLVFDRLADEDKRVRYNASNALVRIDAVAAAKLGVEEHRPQEHAPDPKEK